MKPLGKVNLSHPYGRSLGWLSNLSIQEQWRHFKKRVKYFRWTHLDAYIMRQYVFSFFGSGTTIVSLLLLVMILDNIKSVGDAVHVDFWIQQYPYISVYWLELVQSFGVLFASLFMATRLANQKETIAMVSTGTSIHRIYFYPLMFTIGYSLVFVWISNQFGYPMYQHAQFINKDARAGKTNTTPYQAEYRGRTDFVVILSGVIYVVQQLLVREDGLHMRNVTVLSLRESDTVSGAQGGGGLAVLSKKDLELTNIITKQKSLYEQYMDLSIEFHVVPRYYMEIEEMTWDPTNTVWNLFNGVSYFFDQAGTSFTRTEFTNAVLPQKNATPEIFAAPYFRLEELSIRQLIKISRRQRFADIPSNRVDAYISGKLENILRLFVIYILGISLVDISQKHNSLAASFLKGLGIMLLHYIAATSGTQMAVKLALMPFVLPFMSTSVLLLYVLYRYRRMPT